MQDEAYQLQRRANPEFLHGFRADATKDAAMVPRLLAENEALRAQLQQDAADATPEVMLIDDDRNAFFLQLLVQLQPEV